MKKLTSIALLFMSAAACASDAGRYVANDSDKSASSLVSRWAALDGRTVKWEADGDFPIHDTSRLNAEAHLASASSLNDAFDRVAKMARREIPDSPMLFSCSYRQATVALVVREAGQPECGKAVQ
ncbi:MAG: hypothetical protein ACN6OP_28345 [Pseudomonadales bacterium]